MSIMERTILFENGIYKVEVSSTDIELWEGSAIVLSKPYSKNTDIVHLSYLMVDEYLNKGGYREFMKILRIIDQVVDHKYLKMSEETWLTYLKSEPAQYLRGLKKLIEDVYDSSHTRDYSISSTTSRSYSFTIPDNSWHQK